MLAGNKNRPETDCAAHPKDAKSSLSDFFTSTVDFKVRTGHRILKMLSESCRIHHGRRSHFLTQAGAQADQALAIFQQFGSDDHVIVGTPRHGKSI